MSHFILYISPLQVESLLQALLQTFIAMVLFMGVRNPTYVQWLSQFTSMVMVVLSLSKVLMPPGVWGNKDMSLFSKIRNILWTVIMVSKTTAIVNGIIMHIAFCWRMYPALPPLNQKVGLILTIISLVFFIPVKIFVYKSKQVQLKFVVLSIHSLWVFLSFTIVFYVLFLPHWSHIGNGGVAMANVLFYDGGLSWTILYAHAAFTATKLTDILSFDKLTSKSGFSMKIFLHIQLIAPLIFVTIMIMSSSTMYYN